VIDKISKKFLKWLSTQPDHQYMYYDDHPDEFGSRDEFFAMVRYLESTGLIEIINNHQGIHCGVRLSHIAIHNKEFSFLSFVDYLKNKWVDILALIISVLALIGAYRNEINALIQKLMP
jgi:hypothetical protein